MWARLYDKCIECGRTDYKHVSRGLCNSCYMKEYRLKNSERINRQKKECYERKKEYYKMIHKLYREKINFDGKREEVLKRDNYTCQRCGSKSNLVVHHIDKKGRGSKIKNNSIDNLITLCRKCHIEVHRGDLLKAKKTKSQKRWAKSYDKCIECGTTEVRHNARGLCRNCYARYIRRIKKSRAMI